MTTITPALPISVNYRLTVEEMVERGKYGLVDTYNITQENFPHDAEREVEEVKLELIHFERRLSTDEVLTELKKQSFRPATACELLALGEQHPEEQRKHFIAALGSVWESPLNYRLAVYLFAGILGRTCNLRHTESDWDAHWRFAAVRI